jgi:ABC-type multidrug transport system ATPase subunit
MDPMNAFVDQLQKALGPGYELAHELLGGGMSRVFVARDKALGRTIVVKVLPPELAAGMSTERFRREIQLAAQLQHPHIVTVLSAGEAGDLLWYTMPFIDGESLRTMMERKKSFSTRETLRLLHDIVDALAHAHRRGVVHRDIKPANILTQGTNAMVADFGVAKALKAAMPGEGRTTAGMAIGTPEYMAPEQLAGDLGVDGRADLYAVGLIAYQMLSGELPFAGLGPRELMKAHLTKDPTPLSELVPSVPPAVSGLVMRLLAREPDNRPASADAVLDELEELAITGPITPAVGGVPAWARGTAPDSLAVETKGLEYIAGRGPKAFHLQDVNLRVPTGCVYGFLGPNGSGKTTTLRILLGLTKAKAGDIRVLGESMPEHYETVLAKVGYVPERPHVYPNLRVSEAIELHRAFYPTWDQKWADDLRSIFLLDPDRRQSALSKGEAGKLQMLLALAQRPQLLVLDEPTDGLDPVVRRDILGAVLSYVNDTKATVLISSHLVHELERICDWVGVMDGGRLIDQLPMETFRSGIKRLRVSSAPETLINPPFTVLSRDRSGTVESWLVRGWAVGMQDYLASTGTLVREVIDLDLEEGFVEMLRASRTRR